MILQCNRWAPALEVPDFTVRCFGDLFAQKDLLISYWCFRTVRQSFLITLCHELFITIVATRSYQLSEVSQASISLFWHFRTICTIGPCGDTPNSPSELARTETWIRIFQCHSLLSCIFRRTRNRVLAALGNLLTYLSMISSSSKNPYFLIACSLANLLFRMLAGVGYGCWPCRFVVFVMVFSSYYKSIVYIFIRIT